MLRDSRSCSTMGPRRERRRWRRSGKIRNAAKRPHNCREICDSHSAALRGSPFHDVSVDPVFYLSEQMMGFARLLVGFTIGTALMVVLSDDAMACECGMGSLPCQSAFVDAVFAGTAHSITPLPDDGPPPPPGSFRIPRYVRVEFTDAVAFRGSQASTMSVVTPGSGLACGYEFKEGQRYLVYANRSADGAGLVTGMCSRTRLFANANEDLRLLQTPAPNGTRARIYGTVFQQEEDLATDQQRPYGPVSDFLVTVRGADGAFDARTDSSGHYEVGVLGSTRSLSSPPTGFSTRYLRQSVELQDPRACFEADFSVRFDGRIRGVVRQSSGEPAEAVPVYVMAAENVGKTGNIRVIDATTDAGGSFEVIEVPPGRYVVGVDLTRRMDAQVVFPPTYHPGTADAASATVVQLDGGQQRELEPMTLPPARRPYRLTGTVAFDDGRPASGVRVGLRDGITTWRAVADVIVTKSDGTFSFVGHDGLSYIVQASYWDGVQSKGVSATVGPFVVTQDSGLLKMVLPAPSLR